MNIKDVKIGSVILYKNREYKVDALIKGENSVKGHTVSGWERVIDYKIPLSECSLVRY